MGRRDRAGADIRSDVITGTFFRFVARRLDTRAEGLRDAEISDGAVSWLLQPASWWPVFIALSASVRPSVWRCAALADRGRRVLRVGNAAGLVFEYYTGPERTDANKGHNGQQLARNPRCGSVSAVALVVLPRQLVEKDRRNERPSRPGA